jgi:hypothetical protein
VAILRFVTWSLCDYANPAAREHKREQAIREELNAMDADVYAVQEIMGNTPHDREVAFVALAAELGLSCTVHTEHGIPVVAFDPGRGRRGMGLMWRPSTVTPVRGTAHTHDEAQLAVGMAMASLEVEGVALTFASALLPPRRPHQRVDDCGYIALEVTNAGPLGIVGANWNNVFASRKASGHYYDPDPYKGLGWRPSLWSKARRIAKEPVARREAMEAVEDCGLVDPAARIGAPQYRTAGHWGTDEINQRVDGPFVTAGVADAVMSISAIDTPPTSAPKDDGGLSNHLPVELVVNVARALQRQV